MKKQSILFLWGLFITNITFSMHFTAEHEVDFAKDQTSGSASKEAKVTEIANASARVALGVGALSLGGAAKAPEKIFAGSTAISTTKAQDEGTAKGAIISMPETNGGGNKEAEVEISLEDVEIRMNNEDIFKYSLTELLEHAHAYPAYYGHLEDEQITELYETAQASPETKRILLDQIKADARTHSLESILEYAQLHSEYKGLIPYQEIIDIYYMQNSDEIPSLSVSFNDACKSLHLDTRSASFVTDMQKFLKAYRVLPSSTQSKIVVNTRYGTPILEGGSILKAEKIVEWLNVHRSDDRVLAPLLELLRS